jgi:hypothetical protein
MDRHDRWSYWRSELTYFFKHEKPYWTLPLVVLAVLLLVWMIMSAGTGVESFVYTLF